MSNEETKLSPDSTVTLSLLKDSHILMKSCFTQAQPMSHTRAKGVLMFMAVYLKQLEELLELASLADNPEILEEAVTYLETLILKTRRTNDN